MFSVMIYGFVYIGNRIYVLWADSPENLKIIECGPQTVQPAQYSSFLGQVKAH